MAISRRVRYGIGIAAGMAVIALSIPSQQGLPAVTTNSPGIVTGSGTTAAPLDVKLTVDGSTVDGTGSAGSPLTAPIIAGLPFGLFGDGRDGSSAPCGTISSNTTLTRTIWCTSLTINSGVTLNPAGYRIFVDGTLQLDGKIARNGGNATSAANGAGAAGNVELCGGGGGGTGGLSCFAGGTPNPGGCAGGGFELHVDECSNSGGTGGVQNGGAGVNGGACKGGGGGGGQNAANGVGCAGGQVNVTSLVAGSWRAPFSAYYMVAGSTRSGSTQPFTQAYTGGTGGGGGSSGDFGGCTANGRGGGGGGVIMIAARKITGSGSVEATGGNGANATGSGSAKCGGGGGGGGGVISIFIGTGSFPTTNVTGGTGGTSGGTNPGGRGGNGGAGKVVLIKAGL